ncbi:hypothetical protein TNCV_4052061 [Trichonephila clavipes]|nr:hypothetical protein TNCV_4052061 [Trichonephila clavipes]
MRLASVPCSHNKPDLSHQLKEISIRVLAKTEYNMSKEPMRNIDGRLLLFFLVQFNFWGFRAPARENCPLCVGLSFPTASSNYKSTLQLLGFVQHIDRFLRMKTRNPYRLLFFLGRIQKVGQKTLDVF